MVVGLVEPEQVLVAGDPACGTGFHFPCVTTKWKWRKLRLEFYVRCWECDLFLGPFPTNEDAFQVIVRLNTAAVGIPRG